MGRGWRESLLYVTLHFFAISPAIPKRSFIVVRRKHRLAPRALELNSTSYEIMADQHLASAGMATTPQSNPRTARGGVISSETGLRPHRLVASGVHLDVCHRRCHPHPHGHGKRRSHRRGDGFKAPSHFPGRRRGGQCGRSKNGCGDRTPGKRNKTSACGVKWVLSLCQPIPCPV